MYVIKKYPYDMKKALIDMQHAAERVGTYTRQAAYREANCLTKARFEGGGISGYTEVRDEKCVIISKKRQSGAGCGTACNCSFCRSRKQSISDMSAKIRQRLNTYYLNAAKRDTENMRRDIEYEKTMRLLRLTNRSKE